MRVRDRLATATRPVLALAVAAGVPLAADDLDERVAVMGVASLVTQCQRLDGGNPDAELCRSSLAFQPALSYRPGSGHELSIKLGLAAGNGLNDVTSFRIPSWAADLEDQVRDINGTGRDYVLTAWYGHTSDLGGGNALRVVAGIIDSTDFIDTNVYSNDEYVQFMNSALVNGPNAFAPSYAPGLMARWLDKRVSLTAVYMNVGREDADSFDFYGIELGYRLDTPLGEGNYRLLLDTTGPDFESPTGASRVRRSALLVSCDQRVAGSVGVFVRASQQNDEPSIEYRSLYSGGVDVGGAPWGRPRDNLGVGYARLAGGNGDVGATRVAELYYRFAIVPALSVTADVQYMADDLRSSDGPSGFLFGVRLTTRF